MNVLVLSPVEIEIPAGQGHGHMALGEAAPVAGDGDGAGRRTAGERGAGPPLPDPRPHSPLRLDRGEADVGPPREERVSFEERSGRRQVNRIAILDEEDGMWIADTDAGGGRRRGITEINLKRVGRPRQRDVSPAEPGTAHVDVEHPLPTPASLEQPGPCFDAGVVPSGLIHEQPGDAAGSVAAGLGLAAVRVPDAHEGIARDRRLETDELIASHTDAAVRNRADRARGKRSGTLPGVDDDEIIAQAVHLDETDRIHGCCYIGADATGVHAHLADEVTPMTTLNRLPVLERRRIQAEVVRPLWQAMKAEVGEAGARRILSSAIVEAAIAEGREFAEKNGGPGGLRGFLSFQHLWDADGALETEVARSTDDEYVYRVTRCRYAEMYREMGLAEIGFELSCNRDATFATGYDPRIRLRRTQTIMQGADHCDFHYRMVREES